jgi:hypothetical protein
MEPGSPCPEVGIRGSTPGKHSDMRVLMLVRIGRSRMGEGFNFSFIINGYSFL